MQEETGPQNPSLDMPRITLGHGLALVLLALGMAALTGPTSLATLVPAGFGALLLGLGWLAKAHPGSRKHAMHAAAAVATLGLVATVRPAFDALAALAGGPPESPREDSFAGFTAIVLASLLWLCVRSFRAARRARG